MNDSEKASSKPPLGRDSNEKNGFHEGAEKNTTVRDITPPRPDLDFDQLPAWQQRVILHDQSQIGSTKKPAEDYEVIHRQDTEEENAQDVQRLGHSIHPRFVDFSPTQEQRAANPSHVSTFSSFAASSAPSSQYKHAVSSQSSTTLWTPSSNGNAALDNKPKCPPCIRAKKGECKGGPPCSYCVNRNLTAGECQSFEKLGVLRRSNKKEKNTL